MKEYMNDTSSSAEINKLIENLKQLRERFERIQDVKESASGNDNFCVL